MVPGGSDGWGHEQMEQLMGTMTANPRARRAALTGASLAAAGAFAIATVNGYGAFGIMAGAAGLVGSSSPGTSTSQGLARGQTTPSDVGSAARDWAQRFGLDEQDLADLGLGDLGLDDLGQGGQGSDGSQLDPGLSGPGEEGFAPGTGTGSTASQSLSATGEAAAEAVTPAVVNIDTEIGYGVGEAAGTGIVLSADGLVLTNHHVVDGSTSISGTVVGTGRTYEATVLGYDDVTDIAVIRLTGASNLPVASLGDGVDVGELVVGVGNAGGVGGQPTSVEGRVTAEGATITVSDMAGGSETLRNLIEVTADIQSGQSGGPLVDAQGDVVGVDVAASMSHGSSDITGYAIPIEDAMSVADSIVAGRATDTTHVGASAFLGVELGHGGYQAGSSGAGVTIAGTVDGSAAQAAGLQAGDVLTGFDGRAITSGEQLSALIAEHAVGDRVELSWVDGSGQDQAATVALGEGPVA